MLSVQGLGLHHSGNYLFQNVNFAIKKDDKIGLVGKNGAGKSTLMSVLYGMYKPDEGQIVIDGTELVFASPADAIGAGIGMVHQHFMLVPTLSATENLILADMVENRAWFGWPAGPVRRRIATQAESFGWDIDLDARIDTQTIGAQQRLEKVRGLQRG